jgi:hypothetical protein
MDVSNERKEETMRATPRFRRLTCAHAVAILLGSTLVVAQAGWHKAGSHPADYDMGNDTTTAFTGTSSGFIKSSKPNPQGFGTYMQTVDAADYRGKRVQLSAYVKSVDVADWAGVWMRIDASPTTPIAFDNMQDRPIKGSHDWTQYQLVLDVGSNATAIAFGVLLSGKGSIWIDDVALDAVSTSVPVTDLWIRKSQPRNLDFEAPAKP